MKPKAIIYGTSPVGIRTYQIMNQEYDIVGFSSRDYKDNPRLCDKPVYDPRIIKALNLPIILAVSHKLQKEVYNYLHETLKIHKEKIHFPYTSVYKIISFEDPHIAEEAKKSLIFLCSLLESSKIPYYLDGGTLLGIARNGRLIPWDNDVDISIFSEYATNVFDLISKNLDPLKELTLNQWHCYFTYYEEDTVFCKQNTPRKIVLRSSSGLHMAIIARYKYENYYCYEAVSKIFSNSSSFFSHYERLNFYDSKLSVPYNYKDFLTETYGKWEIEKKNWSYEDYQCTSTFSKS